MNTCERCHKHKATARLTSLGAAGVVLDEDLCDECLHDNPKALPKPGAMPTLGPFDMWVCTGCGKVWLLANSVVQPTKALGLTHAGCLWRDDGEPRWKKAAILNIEDHDCSVLEISRRLDDDDGRKREYSRYLGRPIP